MIIKEPSYTWDESYILPLESRFSIRDKFCYLNAYGWSDFSKVNKNSKYLPYNDDESLELLPQVTFLFQDNIKYCQKCMEYGYHSMLHQSSLFEHCFIHRRQRLIETTVSSYTGSVNVQRDYVVLHGQNVRVEDIVLNSKLKSKIDSFVADMAVLKTTTPEMLFLNTANYKKFYGVYKSSISFYEYKFGIKSKYDSGRVRLVSCISNDEIIKSNSNVIENACKKIISHNPDYEQTESKYSILNTCFRRTEEGCYLPVMYSSPILYRAMVHGIIESTFDNSTHLYYECTESLKATFEHVRSRKKEYLEQYAAIISLYCIQRSVQPELYNKLFKYWVDTREYFYANSLPIVSTLDSLKINDNDFSVFKDLILRRTYSYTKDTLYKWLGKSSTDWKYQSLVFQELPIAVPQYIITLENDAWHLYECDPD